MILKINRHWIMPKIAINNDLIEKKPLVINETSFKPLFRGSCSSELFSVTLRSMSFSKQLVSDIKGRSSHQQNNVNAHISTTTNVETHACYRV